MATLSGIWRNRRELSRIAARAPLNLWRGLSSQPVYALLYHRVGNFSPDPARLAVTPDNFRRQMRHVRERYGLLRWEDDWARTERPSVVVTFDDGYADNLHQALPILEECGVPATFFICGGVIGNEAEFWWDEAERLLLHGGALPERFAGEATRTPAERAAFHGRLIVRLKALDDAGREELLAELRAWSGLPAGRRDSHRGMTQEELLRLAAHPLATIGAHTLTHPVLSSLSPARQDREIAGSKALLEEWLGRPVEHFAYPFGKWEDYGSGAVAACRRAGILKAATTELGRAYAGSPTLEIPRMAVGDWDEAVFTAKLRLYRRF